MYSASVAFLRVGRINIEIKIKKIKIVEEIEAKKRGIRCAVYIKLLKLTSIKHMFELFNNNDITSSITLMNEIHSHNKQKSKNLNIYI